VPPERRVRLAEDFMRAQARENRMQENLDRSAARAGNAQVEALVRDMQEIGGVAAWHEEFQQLPQGDLDGRARAVAFLLFEIIEPNLVETREVRFLEWRGQARMILPYFLRETQHGPTFLRLTEIGLREARLFFKKSQDFSWFQKFVRAILRQESQSLGSQLDQACKELSLHLQELQNHHVQKLQGVKEELDAQDAMMNALAEQVLQGTVEMGALIDKIGEEQQKFAATKDAAMKMCKEIMQS
jgi:hypothetical protein